MGGGGLGHLASVATLGIIPDSGADKAASDAKDAQVGAAQNANAVQQQIYDQNKSNYQPWLDAGKSGISQLQSAMPDITRQFGASDFQQDPGYQFALNQGMQAMQRSAAAKGMLGSTGTMQNLNNYAQGMASQQYQNAYDRFTQNQNQRYNMLSGLAGQGMGAANGIAGVGQNYANAYGNNMASIGNAQAASTMAGYNNTASAFSGGLGLLGAASGMGLFNKTPAVPAPSPVSGGFAGMDPMGGMRQIA